MTKNKDEGFEELIAPKQLMLMHVEPKHASTKREKYRRRYYLNGLPGGAYLTWREAETTMQVLLGKTIKDTAISMHISPRTAEFYINNIKRKLKCRTKTELISKIMRTDFLKKYGEINN